MWLFTRRGFYSIVASPDVPVCVQIRARDKVHLENLAIPDAKILETPTADYPFRVIVPHGYAVQLVTLLAQEIDYSNFKDVIDSQHGADNWFSAACHEVWSVIWESAYSLRRRMRRVEAD